ncbi:MAG TPA: serpin family protein, partial [Silvibacterium sp.]|nr:serpin family protein [Silvibacterium sp.]
MRWLLALVLFLMSGTSALPDQNTTDAGRALAQPYAQFGFDVLRDLTAKSPRANAFISPTSIAVALAMTANGADGATRDAILAALHSQGQSTTEFNAANRALADQVARTTAVQLSMANAIWVQEGIAIEPAFRQTLQSEYGAEAENVDFRTPAAEHTINTWVAKHTNDRIRKLVENIAPSTVAMLTNAIAFKGKWSIQFDAKETQPHHFTTAAGNTKKVPMMKHYGQYKYANTNGLETIRLPYADETFAMYVVLPQNETRMRSFLDQLTSDSFSTLASSLAAQKGTIELPRFTLEYSATLNSVLTQLGMGAAFGSTADFRNISKTRRLQISEV